MKEIQARGLGVAAISYDSPELIAAFSKQRGVTFPLLSDKGSATIKSYGILNTVVAQALGPDRDNPAIKADAYQYVSAVGARADMAGIAFPGTFVLDKGGRVTARYFEDFYIDRNTVSSLMVKVGGPTGAAVAATKISSNYLDVTAYTSDPAVAPGNRFSVVLDVTPHVGLHVYAPGAETMGYRVIAFALEPNPRIKAFAVQYPKSEIYDFKPLKQRVPVYQKPFRLVQELLLDGTPAGQEALRGKTELTVAGTLQYQACDAKICYNPVSVPFSWTLSLRTLIRERPTVAP